MADFIVIARSKATKQSRIEIATPSASQKARNDKEGRLPRLPFGKPRNDKKGKEFKRTLSELV